MSRSSILPPIAAGLLAAAALLAVSSGPVRLAPGRPGWARLVGGVTPAGVMPDRGMVSLPGLDRSGSTLLVVTAEDAAGAAASLGVAVDGGPAQWVRTSRAAAAAIVLPRSRAPGARVALLRSAGSAAPRLVSVHVERDASLLPWPAALISALAAGLVAGALASRLGRDAAFALALAVAAFVALAFTPALLWLTLPGASSVGRLALPALLMAAAAGFAAQLRAPRRRQLLFATAIAAAFVFGAWVRAAFMTSAGSWDTEYWKGWTARMHSRGITRVYGEPEPFALRRFAALMRGEEPLATVGTGLTIDYPPLAMYLLRVSSAFSTPAASRLEGSEAQNVVVKMLPVLGDLGAVAFLLAAFRRRPGRALGLAALYWAAPPSWLSSAVLGYVDGAYVPLSAAALWMAGRGRPVWAGALLALAGLVKATALLIAPAVAMALWAAGAPLGRAVAAGIVVVAATMLPFVAAGTAHLAVAQVFRIVFQRTFSGGFANLWWLVGHVVSVSGGADFAAPVRFVRQEALRLPVAPIGLTLFALATAYVLRAQRKVPGPRPAALAGAAVVFCYGMLALGVHENHPHAMVLLLVCSGLFSRRLQLIFAGVAVSYTANILALSGLGRFYGPRHLLIEPLTRVWPLVRVAPGFDVTLLLVVLNLVLFTFLLLSLPAELRCAQAAPSVIAGGEGPAARDII